MSERINIRRAVGTTSTRLMTFKIKDLQNLVFYAVGALELAEEPVTVGTGDPLSIGGRKIYTHLDFRKDDKEVQESKVTVYGVATVATTVHIIGRA